MAFLGLAGVGQAEASALTWGDIATSPNARLRLSGGGLPAYRDLLLNLTPDGVQFIAPDTTQTGANIPLSRLSVKVDGAQATFSGRFLPPTARKPVPFDGVFRVPGAESAGAVRIEVN